MFNILFPFVFVALANGGFFDLTDVEDPLALLWNLPNVNIKMSECIIDSARSGLCMDKARCLFSGGTPTGHCGLMFTCCSYEQNCVKTSNKKQSYFEVTDLNAAVTNCKYTINLRNKNVCQVRLDFVNLTLAPAIQTASISDDYTCSIDKLRITPNNYGVPDLCGNNTQQHLYIHVNQSTDTDKAINIDISLASRQSQEAQLYLPKPTWKIKFTQLECPVKKNKFDIFKFKDFDDITNDFSVLAPQGALQYFTEPQGEIRSFAFNTTVPTVTKDRTSYPYSEHYTIAFKRPSNVCGIRFTPVTLKLFSLDENNCYHYLVIPELYKLQIQTNSLQDTGIQVCSNENYQLYSFSPGPFYINFKATLLNNPQSTSLYHQGFKLNYELLNDCPVITT